MIKKKFVILGAGPSGLTLANSLISNGVDKSEVLLLEKEAEAGGLCRSKIIDGSPLDIGGGHFLDVRRSDVLDFLFSFMPKEEWSKYKRVSKINLNNYSIDHPLEANLWQLPKHLQVDYLEDISKAGCQRGDEMPISFVDWIRWKFGSKIAADYMLPYNEKIWSVDL